MDRTARNTNMLIWNRALWLIDHGASLYFHHNWQSWENQMKSPFQLVKDHVLLKEAALLHEADQVCKDLLNETVIDDILNVLPEDWLAYEETQGVASDTKKVYREFLNFRLQHSGIFLKQAIDARAAII